MNRPGQQNADHIAALAALLVDQLPAAIKAARAISVLGTGPLSPSRFLDAWRSELVRRVEAAVSPARTVAAIPTLFAVCDVSIAVHEGAPGIHLRGEATPALGTALRLMKVHDSARRTRVGEELMAMLLADVAEEFWRAERQKADGA